MSIDHARLFSTFKEYPEPVEADVQGEIPKWVKGNLLKNGPGIFEVGQDTYKHWFDGLAIMQNFEIENGKVRYSSKYLRSETFKRNMASQRIVVGEFGTFAYPDPCKNIFHRYFSYFLPQKLTDNDLVNFVQCGDEVYAATETAILTKIDPKTMDTLEQVDMHKCVSTVVSTAHPQYDRDGNMYNLGSYYTSYNVIFTPNPLNEATKNGSALLNSKIIATIPTKYLSYYHSFGQSENYVIYPETPLFLTPWKILTAPFLRNSFSDCMTWYPNMKTVFHLVGIRDSKKCTVRCTADAFFTFHHANSYEIENCIVADLVSYKDGNVVKQVSLESLRGGQFSKQSNSNYGSLWRFVLPTEIPSDAKPGDNLLKNKTFQTTATAILQEDGTVHCTHQLLTDKFVEFPRINYEKCNGLPYQFCYAAGINDSDEFLLTELCKIDVNSNERKEWIRDHDGQFVGEPVFIPRPGSVDEDDGVVFSPITDVTNENRNFLLVLDGKSFKELARAHINRLIAPGFHGHFVG